MADLRLADLGQALATGRTAEVFALGDGRVHKLLLPAFPADIAVHEADVAGRASTVYPFAPRLFGTITIDERRGRGARQPAVSDRACDRPGLNAQLAVRGRPADDVAGEVDRVWGRPCRDDLDIVTVDVRAGR
jgi:hypothetical protein